MTLTSSPKVEFLAGCLAILFLCSAVSGILLMVALYKKRSNTVTALFVKSIVSVDLGLVVTIAIPSFTSMVAGEWLFQDIGCTIQGVLVKALINISNVLLLMLAEYRLTMNQTGEDRNQSRDVSRIVAAVVASLFMVFLSVIPLLRISYKYVHGLFHCDLEGDWYSVVSESVLGILLPLCALFYALRVLMTATGTTLCHRQQSLCEYPKPSVGSLENIQTPIPSERTPIPAELKKTSKLLGLFGLLSSIIMLFGSILRIAVYSKGVPSVNEQLSVSILYVTCFVLTLKPLLSFVLFPPLRQEIRHFTVGETAVTPLPFAIINRNSIFNSDQLRNSTQTDIPNFLAPPQKTRVSLNLTAPKNERRPSAASNLSNVSCEVCVSPRVLNAGPVMDFTSGGTDIDANFPPAEGDACPRCCSRASLATESMDSVFIRVGATDDLSPVSEMAFDFRVLSRPVSRCSRKMLVSVNEVNLPETDSEGGSCQTSIQTSYQTPASPSTKETPRKPKRVESFIEKKAENLPKARRQFHSLPSPVIYVQGPTEFDDPQSKSGLPVVD